MSKTKPSYETAMRVLPKLIAKIPPKVIAAEEGVSYSVVTQVKKMFPLFLGLPRQYNHKDDP